MAANKNPGGETLLGIDDKFKFSCHEGLACFKKCCRDISIFLTPFDVLRMKNKLKVPSGEFLRRYTIPFTAGYSGFPLLLIKMSEEDDLKCPFITEKGCGVYNERPWSCRMAPVEIRGRGAYGFCFDRSRCHGLGEEREQTVREWMRDQGMEVYDGVEGLFQEIPLKVRPTGRKELDQLMMKAFHLASYDLDRFREFVLSSPFKKAYGLSGEEAEKLRKDDQELLQFGFRWLLQEFTSREGIEKAAGLLKEFM